MKNKEEIKKQAEYCLHCKTKPCQKGCPLQNNIPEFINCIKEEKYEEAFEILSQTTIFEPICGRICPHQSQCQGSCTRGIKGEPVHIGELEACVGDYMLASNKLPVQPIKANGKKVAIIGSGPAGLACSYYLSTRGYQVSIYEKHSKLGGLLRYGIPDFRLSKELLDQWLKKWILNENVQVFTNKELGRNLTLEDLKKECDAIILAIGSNISNKMGIEGEEVDNVLGGNELLEYKKMPNFQNKKVAVIGGGNVAIDTARTVKRLNPQEVSIIYRRAEEQMPAEKKEIEDAKKEGIKFLFQTNVLRVLPKKIECVKTQLIQKKGETRAYPINVEKSNFLMDVDYVIMAVGASPDKKIIDKLGLETDKFGYIKVNEYYQTSNEKIFAIGDLVGTKQTVAWAAKSGLECAKSIINKKIQTK